MKVYEKLARHLDKLPAGFPPSESGVEIRILQRLFSPEEAELTMFLTLIAEDARVVAFRAGRPLEKVSRLLKEMDDKGLIFSILQEDGFLRYRIQQFVVGFWEGQVNKLYPELVEDFEEYLDTFIDLDLWQRMPQLRTIPIEKSIELKNDVMPYEHAEELVHEQSIIALNNCICRQELHLLDKGCDSPVESCLSFGMAAERSIRQNRGRPISVEEAIEVLHEAERDGRVLQTGNAKKILFLCTCCSCCCGVLRSIKSDPNPASRVSSPYLVSCNPLTCTGCGVCITRCPMVAFHLDKDKVVHEPNRCIGCGLCVSTCPSDALSMQRKAKAEQAYVPRTLSGTYIRLGMKRGKMSIGSLLSMQYKSTRDRVRSKLLRIEQSEHLL